MQIKSPLDYNFQLIIDDHNNYKKLYSPKEQLFFIKQKTTSIYQMINKINFTYQLAQQMNEISKNTALINNIQVSHGQDLIIQYPISQRLRRLLSNPFYTQKQQQIKNQFGMALFDLKQLKDEQYHFYQFLKTIISQFYLWKIKEQQQEIQKHYQQIKKLRQNQSNNDKAQQIIMKFKSIKQIKEQIEKIKKQQENIKINNDKTQQSLLLVVFKYQQQLKTFLNNKQSQNFRQTFPISNDPKIVNLQNKFLKSFNAIIHKDYLKQKPFFNELHQQSKSKLKLKQELAQQQRQEPVLKQIRQYLNQLCHKVLSYGYKLLMENKLNSDQMKSFCSINILFNVKKLLQANINNSEVSVLICQKINEYIKCFMNTYIQKYHITWTKASKEVHSNVKNFYYNPNSSWEDNDFLGLNKIKIEYKQDGDYFPQIMAVINKAIQVANQVDQQSNMKNIESFYQFFKLVAIFSSDQVNSENQRKQRKQSKENKYLQQIFPNYILKKFKKNIIQLQNDKQDQECDNWYETKFENNTKMKQKISNLQCNSKIDPTTPLFSQFQIQSREFSVKHSSILRLIVKWTQLLIQKTCFQKLNDENLKYKTNDFKTIELTKDNKMLIDLEGKKKVLTQNIGLILQTLQDQLKGFNDKIEKMIKVIKCEHNFLQYLIGLQNNPKDFVQQKISNIGNFSSEISQLQSRHIVSLLNSVIHILLDITQNKLSQKIKQQKIIDQLKKINLITFQIGDLIRGKYSCSQNQFVRFMKILQNIQRKKPEVIKFIVIKNRFSQITNDVLMQFIFKKKVKCEFQISLKGGANSENNKKKADFNHFLYQITRTLINPVSQMASIIKKVDPLISTSIFGKCLQKGLKHSYSKEIKQILQYQLQKQKKFLYLPQICQLCKEIKLIFEEQKQQKQRSCMDCWIQKKRKKVSKQKEDKDKKDKKLFKEFKKKYKNNNQIFQFIQGQIIQIQQLTQLKKSKQQQQHLNYGVFVNLKKQKRQIQFFIQFEIFDQIKYYSFSDTITEQVNKQLENINKRYKQNQKKLKQKDQQQKQRIIFKFMESSLSVLRQLQSFKLNNSNQQIKVKNNNFIFWKLKKSDKQKKSEEQKKLEEQKTKKFFNLIKKIPSLYKSVDNSFIDLLKQSLKKKILPQIIKRNEQRIQPITSEFMKNIYESDKAGFENIKVFHSRAFKIKNNQIIEWTSNLKNAEKIYLCSQQQQKKIQSIYLPKNYKKIKTLFLEIPVKNIYIASQKDSNQIKNIQSLEKIELFNLNLQNLKIQNMKNLKQIYLLKFISSLELININNCPSLKTLRIENMKVTNISLYQLPNLKQLLISHPSQLDIILCSITLVQEDKKYLQNKQKLKDTIYMSNKNIQILKITNPSPKIKKIFIQSCYELRQLYIPKYIKEMEICQASNLDFKCKSNKESKLQKITISNNQNLQNVEIYWDNKYDIKEECPSVFSFQNLNPVSDSKEVSFKFWLGKLIKVKQIIFKNCPKIKSFTSEFQITQISPQNNNKRRFNINQKKCLNINKQIQLKIFNKEQNKYILIKIQN